MNMTLRIEEYWVDIASAGHEHISKEFHDNLPDILNRADDEDDDDWVDLEIINLDQLYLYLDAFKDFSMALFLAEDSNEIKIDFTLYNKKIRYNDGKYLFTRTEVKRDVVAKNLNERIGKAIAILEEGRFDHGK